MKTKVDRLTVSHWRWAINYGSDFERKNAAHDACDAVIELLRQVEELEIAVKEQASELLKKEAGCPHAEGFRVKFQSGRVYYYCLNCDYELDAGYVSKKEGL